MEVEAELEMPVEVPVEVEMVVIGGAEGWYGYKAAAAATTAVAVCRWQR